MTSIPLTFTAINDAKSFSKTWNYTSDYVYLKFTPSEFRGLFDENKVVKLTFKVNPTNDTSNVHTRDVEIRNCYQLNDPYTHTVNDLSDSSIDFRSHFFISKDCYTVTVGAMPAGVNFDPESMVLSTTVANLAFGTTPVSYSIDSNPRTINVVRPCTVLIDECRNEAGKLPVTKPDSFRIDGSETVTLFTGQINNIL